MFKRGDIISYLAAADLDNSYRYVHSEDKDGNLVVAILGPVGDFRERISYGNHPNWYILVTSILREEE